MEIQFLWIRHAHSCGNAKSVSTRSNLYKALFLQSRNPQISNLGVVQINQARQALSPNKQTLGDFLDHQIDLVCSSDMTRAIETALLLFPQKIVHVVPFVGEHAFSELARRINLDVENQPDSPKKIPRVNYDLYTNKHDRPNFIKFLEKIVVKHWMEKKIHTLEKPFRIAIVSHGNFMKNMFLHHTQTNKRVFQETPYFVPNHCLRPHYKPTVPAIGNLGMFTTLWTRENVQDHLSGKQRLPKLMPVYETNAVYDPTTGQCIEYDGKRFITSGLSRHHVYRCHPRISNMPELLL